VTVNVSSPNTRNLRDLQQEAQVNALLSRLVSVRERLRERHSRQVPLALKVAPDLEEPQLRSIADAVRRHRIEAVIATNTSLSRDGVEGLRRAQEAGGLSGAPIRSRSTRVLKMLHAFLKDEVTLIGSGGILSGRDAAEKIAAGASLVQLYTGLVYRGPRLVAECVEALK
jgi:dihydroorotate dehydrogenase